MKTIKYTFSLFNPQTLGFMRLKTIFAALPRTVILLFSSHLLLGTKLSAKFLPEYIKM